MGWKEGAFDQASISKFCNELTICTLLVVIFPCAQALHGVELLILLQSTVFWEYPRAGLWLCWSMRWGFPRPLYQQSCCMAVPGAALAGGVSSAEQNQAPVQRCPRTWVVGLGKGVSSAAVASCIHVLFSWRIACWLGGGTASVKGRFLESWNWGCQDVQNPWSCVRGTDMAPLWRWIPGWLGKGSTWQGRPRCRAGCPLPARDPPARSLLRDVLCTKDALKPAVCPHQWSWLQAGGCHTWGPLCPGSLLGQSCRAHEDMGLGCEAAGPGAVGRGFMMCPRAC